MYQVIYKYHGRQEMRVKLVKAICKEEALEILYKNVNDNEIEIVMVEEVY